MTVKTLPEKIGVFPLSNAVFFPKTVLPLNIFEKRYIQLVNDCMKDRRLFGMIQPRIKNSLKPEVYKVGCLGKIISFDETSNKRFIINLSGIIRFKIKEELSTNKLYREFKVDYSDFMNDLNINENKKKKYDTKNLIKKIKFFLSRKNYLIELDDLEKLNLDQLISTICMISPFSAEEKQKLIEEIKIEDKLKTLEAILNFNLSDNLENNTIQ